MANKIEYVSIEFVHESYWFCQHGTYGPSSVLAGEDFRQLVKAYDTLEEARAEHPEARVDLEGYAPEPIELPHVAPDWFDPAAAGEVWDDTDY